MHPETQTLLIGSFWGFPYLASFATAILAGYLIPAPEEVIFVLLGYAAVFQDVNIIWVIVAAILGIVVSDNVSYWLGRKGSVWVEKFEKMVGTQIVVRYEKEIHMHAGKTIFTSRFIPTIRVLVPILAGTLKVRWKIFFIYDLLATILNVGALIAIGYIFESQISSVLSKVNSTRHFLSLVSLAIIGTIISLILRSIFFKKDQ
ncbi:MAG: DedA family protein [Parcubacteria group bacterium]|jgi:undecaprenyl-diphosphatase